MKPAPQPRQPYYTTNLPISSGPGGVPPSSGSWPGTSNHVYHSGPGFQMMMNPGQQLSFPRSPQGPAFIPGQYWPTTYVATPHQYPVPAGSSGFFPGTSSTQYGTYAYYPSQSQLSSSAQAAPVIMNHTHQQQQHIRTKRERKLIRVRDPNQGGRDITEEIMSGVCTDSSPSPPQTARSGAENNAVVQASGESITASTTEADRPEDRRKPSTPPEFSNGDSIPSGTTSSHTKTKTLSPPRLSETECTPIHTFSTLGPNTPVIDLMDSPLRPRGPAVPLQSVPKVAADPLHTSSQDRTEKKATEEEVKVEEAKTIEEFAFMETSLALSSTLYSDAQVETESMSVMLPRRNLGAPLESPIAQPEEPCLPNGLPLAAPQDLELPKVSMAERESRPIAELENSQQVKHTLTAITQAAPADQSRPVVQEPVADRAAKAAARPEIKNVVPPLDAKKNSPVPQSTSKEESASEKVPTPPSPTAEEQDSQTFTPALVETTVQELNKAIKYDREFLLGLQFVPVSMVKPDCLPPIKEVVLDKVRKIPIRPQDPNRPSGINGGPDFTPTFTNLARPSLGGGSRGPPSGVEVGIRGQHGSHQMHWKEPRKIITITSLGDAVQLNKAQNAWKPSASKDICGHGGGETLEEQIKTQELLKRFRSILNKLTPQKFEKLMKQVKELNIDSEESLKGVIDLIFEKAISEPTFSVTYANMCHCLMGLKLKSTGVSFHKLLLKRCQTEFEKNKDDDESLEKKTKELEASSETEEKPKLMELQEAKDKNRRRSLGNIKFIGELFKLKMLTQVIMHDCIIKLLKSHDEESLECLCTLLSTIGKDLDFEEAKPRMNQYFHQMDKIVKERKTTSRIRFMLQDVLDLRLNNWVPRRGVQGPKTIDQIHKEAELEEHREQMKVQQALVSKNELGASPVGRMIAEGLDGRGNPHSPCTGAPPQDDGRNTLPISKNQPADISHLHKTTKTNADLNNRLLGPGGKNTCGSWVKGCSGGIGAKPADSGLEAGGHPAISAHNRSPTSQQPLSTSGSSNDSDRQFGQRNSSSQERSDYFDRSVHSCEVEYRGSGDFVFKAAKRGMTDDRGSTERASSVENAKRVTAANALPAEVYSKPSLTEEELNKESIATIEEYLHIKDVKEALLCVQDMNNTQLLFVFVRNGVELTLERSTVDRERMGLLLHHLIQSGTLPTRQYYKGLQEILELAKDMAIDIPFIWLYLAELITPMLDEGGIPMGGLFREISHHLIPLGKAGVLLAHILTLLCKGMSHEKVGTMWREAGLQWKDFLPEVEDVNQFVRERKVEFTLGEESEKSKRKVLGSSEMTKQLDKLIQNQAENQKVIDWIEANLDEQQALSNMFIRTLMTRICRSAIIYENPYRLDSEQIKRRAKLLQKYLKDEQKQLQALYALQAQLVQMDQPANLLRMFFDTLYDEDIIKEEAFYKWESSQDPAEQQGKKVALISVTSFFIWLCEAGNESS